MKKMVKDGTSDLKRDLEDKLRKVDAQIDSNEEAI